MSDTKTQSTPKPVKKKTEQADSDSGEALQFAIAVENASDRVGKTLIMDQMLREAHSVCELENQLFSIGYTCQLLQLPPPAIRELAKAAEVKPAFCINDVPHYDGRGLLEMYRELQRRERKAEPSK